MDTGVYDTGVHDIGVYDTGVHDWPVCRNCGLLIL